MNKSFIILVLCFFAGKVSAQEAFIDEVYRGVVQRMGLGPVSHQMSPFTWNALTYERAVAESVEAALKKPAALYSLINVRVGLTVINPGEGIVIGSREQLRQMTIYPQTFDAEDFIKNNLSPDRIKAIRLNVVRGMREIHFKFLNNLLGNLADVPTSVVEQAGAYIRPKNAMYSELFNLIDETPSQHIGTREFISTLDETLEAGLGTANRSGRHFIIKTFVQSSFDDALKTISKLCRVF